MQPDSDDQLMHAYAQGDARAFDQLYERHRAALYRFVRRLLGTACPQQTDEVFQDSWMRVIQTRDRWAPQGATFRTWLFTIAHHRAIDCLRRQGREISVDELDEAWSPVVEVPGTAGPPRPDAVELQFWRDAGHRLVDCLDALPVAQRAVFLLHHEDGLTLDELARALELGFETAKSRLRYAMNKLRACMGGYLPAGPGQGWA